MNLEPFVRIYRYGENFKYEAPRLYVAGNLEESRDALSDCLQVVSESRAEIDYLSVDGTTINVDNGKLPAAGKFEIKITLPTTGSDRFYHSISEFISINKKTLSDGNFPSEFFLIDDNYYSGDSEKNTNIERLKNHVRFAFLLSKVADYSGSSKTGIEKLVFIRSEEGGANKALTIIPNITPELIKLDLDISDLEAVLESIDEKKGHYVEKRAIFNQSLVDYYAADSEGVELLSVARDWNAVNKLYRDNLDTYISGFSVHKARKEIAEYEFELNKRYSELASQLHSKVLAVPVSVGAIGFMVRFPDFLIQLVFLVAAVVTTWITWSSVNNQEKQADILRHSKRFSVDSFKGRFSEPPEEINEHIRKSKIIFSNADQKLSRDCKYYKRLSFSPTAIAALIIVFTDSRYSIPMKLISAIC
nr:hypothetical protein 12 [Saccharospirillaceae bacterium]